MDLSTRQGRREQGQRLQRAVERAGISIEELAGRIGCSRALIYQYVSGTTLAQPDRMQQIAAVCGVPLLVFYQDDDSILDASAAEAQRSAAPQDVASRVAERLRALQDLAAAQDSPPDYRGLAATCERILLLAEQQDDAGVQVRALFDLGKALNTIGDSLRAVEALMRSVTLASQIGDVHLEISARQSLGKALLMLGRTSEARSQFQQVASSASWDTKWRGLVSLGSIHEQRGEYKEAMQRFDEAAAILDEAAARREATPKEVRVGLLFINANRRNVYLAGGDLIEARALSEMALHDAEALGNAGQNLAARFDLAWCDFFGGRWAAVYQHLQTMLQLARFVGDQSRETRARTGLGIFLAAAGDHDSAIAYGKDALATALSRGDRLAELYAQLALADAYTGIADRTVEALYHANQALAITSSVHYARTEIECRLRLARLHAGARAVNELTETADRALGLARQLGARHLESLALCWQAEALRLSIGDGGADSPTALTAAAETEHVVLHAREVAARALELAAATGFVETTWRTQAVLARLSLSTGDLEHAESWFQASIQVLEPLRAELIKAGLPDTVLENEDCADVYEGLARLLFATNRRGAAVALVERASWPPLNARLNELLLS